MPDARAVRSTLDVNDAADVSFGTEFPQANKGDVFVRVDFMPNKIFRNTGERWIEIPKTYTQIYLDSNEYIAYLSKELAMKRMEIEDLTLEEQEEVAKYIGNRSNRT